jgi:hypothetical protein
MSSNEGGRSRLVVALAAVLALAVVVGGASPATAGKKIKTRIEIKSLKTTGAAGTLASSSDSCLGGREIQISSWDGFRSTRIAGTKSKPNGSWRIQRDLKPDTRYFAQVDSKGKCGYDVTPFQRLG